MFGLVNTPIITRFVNFFFNKHCFINLYLYVKQVYDKSFVTVVVILL